MGKCTSASCASYPRYGKEPMRTWLKNALVIFTLATLGALALSSLDSVSGHGGGFQLTRREIAGPYELVLGTIPDPLVVGEAILILSVANPDTGARVLNADVTVTPEGPQRRESERRTPDRWPGLLRPDVIRGRARSWTPKDGGLFTIDVSGQAGTGSASFAYVVKKLSPIAGLITLAALLAFLTILGLSIRAFIKDRTKGHRARRQKA